MMGTNQTWWHGVMWGDLRRFRALLWGKGTCRKFLGSDRRPHSSHPCANFEIRKGCCPTLLWGAGWASLTSRSHIINSSKNWKVQKAERERAELPRLCRHFPPREFFTPHPPHPGLPLPQLWEPEPCSLPSLLHPSLTPQCQAGPLSSPSLYNDQNPRAELAPCSALHPINYIV